MSKAEPELRVCEVCKRVDGDTRLKMCFFCPLCNAWICEDDTLRVDRRALAMLKE